MQHKEFTVRDLVENPSFQRMVKGIATPGEVEQWNQWIEASSENRAKARKALSEIVGFEFQPSIKPDVERQWSELYQKTSGKEKFDGNQNRTKEIRLRWLFRAVAVFLIIGLAGIGGFYLSGEGESITHLKEVIEEKTITTSEGEEKTLSFSNGARIILNSNSSITYRLGVFPNQPIDVTLEGEAWFEDENNPGQNESAFAVRTPDGIIRDISTKFLVTIENEKSRVVLQEGVVEVERLDRYTLDPENERKVFHVEKGEMVEFNQENIIKREKINPTLYTSWATGFMELDQTGLQEFADYLRQQFEVRVELNDSGLTNITLDGTVYFRSLDELVRSISEVTDIPVYRSADKQTIFIGKVEQ